MINKVLSLLLCALLLNVSPVLAIPLAGGASLGKQSGQLLPHAGAVLAQQALPRQTTTQNTGLQNSSRASGSTAATVPPRRWSAIAGGLAAGLGLAWLVATLGLGAATAQLLLFALLALLLTLAVGSVLRRRRAIAQGTVLAGQSPTGSGQSQFDPATPRGYSPQNVGNDASARPWESHCGVAAVAAAGHGSAIPIGSAWSGWSDRDAPAGFDAEVFLQASKANFLSLQAAWDRVDMPGLRAMMTDTMLAQIKSQLAEREQTRRASANRTEVVLLDAQLLGIEEHDDEYMASVEFSGLIREDAVVGPNPFREIWSITRPKTGPGGWLVAGVQALQ